MMKKKILATMLTLAMAAATLVGCGAKEEAPHRQIHFS